MSEEMLYTISAILVLFIAIIIIKEVVSYNHRKKICRMFKENIDRWFPEPLLCINTETEVMAVCKYKAFKKLVDAQFASARLDAGQSACKIEVWEPDTFTFANNEEVLRPIHTGTKADFEKIIAELVLKITLTTPKEWEELGMGAELKKRIVVNDRRLFVPFTGTTPQINRQLRTFRKRTLGELRETLGLN